MGCRYAWRGAGCLLEVCMGGAVTDEISGTRSRTHQKHMTRYKNKAVIDCLPSSAPVFTILKERFAWYFPPFWSSFRKEKDDLAAFHACGANNCQLESFFLFLFLSHFWTWWGRVFFGPKTIFSEWACQKPFSKKFISGTKRNTNSDHVGSCTRLVNRLPRCPPRPRQLHCPRYNKHSLGCSSWLTEQRVPGLG